MDTTVANTATTKSVKPVKTVEKAPRAKKEPVALHQRLHAQLTAGVLKERLTAEHLTFLAGHIERLKSIVAT